MALELPREWVMLAPQDYYKLNHRAMQAGRDWGTHLIQPATPARVRQCTPGCSGFFPAGSWKIPGIAQSLWTTARSLSACTVIFFFFISHLNISVSARSSTGCSIPGWQEWHATGSIPFLDLLAGLLLTQPSILPAQKAWGELTEHCTAETTGVQKAQTSRNSFDTAQHPLHLEKLAQSLPSGDN